MDEIRPAELQGFADENEVFLLDVREGWEFEARRIPDTVNIPVGEVTRRIHQIPREKVVVVICEHGTRSRRVGEYLIKQGYERVVNLAEGTAGWAETE